MNAGEAAKGGGAGHELVGKGSAAAQPGTDEVVSVSGAGSGDEPVVQVPAAGGSVPDAGTTGGLVEATAGAEAEGTSTGGSSEAIDAADASAADETAVVDEAPVDATQLDATQSEELGDTVGPVEREAQGTEAGERRDATGAAGGARHEDGDSLEARLAALGQGRPITIDQITQL